MGTRWRTLGWYKPSTTASGQPLASPPKTAPKTRLFGRSGGLGDPYDHFVVDKVADDVPTYLMNHSDPSGHGFLALGRRPISTRGHVAENTQGS